MDIREAAVLANELMHKHGLVPAWTFRFDRAKVRFGYCLHSRQLITLSAAMVRVNPVEEVRDTILHEIAHALTPGHYHDHVWKLKASEVGARPDRCYSGDTTVAVASKYIGTCRDCGKQWHLHRRLKDGFESYLHMPCKQKLNGGDITWTLT